MPQFIADLEPALRHKNYMHIDGRPVVLVYRPMLLHDPAATAARWREHCQRAGLGNPYLVATHAFDSVDPLSIGFDAAVEFPPNTGGRALPMDVTSSLVPVNPDYAGTVYRYDDMWRGRLGARSPRLPVLPRGLSRVRQRGATSRQWLDLRLLDPGVVRPVARGRLPGHDARARGRQAPGVRERLERVGGRGASRARPSLRLRLPGRHADGGGEPAPGLDHAGRVPRCLPWRRPARAARLCVMAHHPHRDPRQGAVSGAGGVAAAVPGPGRHGGADRSRASGRGGRRVRSHRAACSTSAAACRRSSTATPWPLAGCMRRCRGFRRPSSRTSTNWARASQRYASAWFDDVLDAVGAFHRLLRAGAGPSCGRARRGGAAGVGGLLVDRTAPQRTGCPIRASRRRCATNSDCRGDPSRDGLRPRHAVPQGRRSLHRRGTTPSAARRVGRAPVLDWRFPRG